MTAPPLPTLADIEEARELLRGVAIDTPMEESRWLSALAGGPVLLKAENLQRTGSFKIRGAYLRMSRLSDEERANGVVAASAGVTSMFCILARNPTRSDASAGARTLIVRPSAA